MEEVRHAEDEEGALVVTVACGLEGQQLEVADAAPHAVPSSTETSLSRTRCHAQPSPTAADAVLIGCVKSRRASGAPAQDLYTSDYFGKMRTYAQRSGKPWFILSAQHGLVAPYAWLESDDCSRFTRSRDYRRGWGRTVASQLEGVFGLLHGRVFDIHAGAAYVEAAGAALGPAGAIIVDQLRGLPIGRRLSWYLQQSTASTGGGGGGGDRRASAGAISGAARRA